jgi:hypothetical protein
MHYVYQANREDQESEVGVSSAVAEGSSASSGDVDDSFDGKETDKESKKKKNRCAVCRKKVGLTGKYTGCITLYERLQILRRMHGNKNSI